MADECAIGLTQGNAPARALVVIGFGHVEGDGAAHVPRHDGRATRKVCQKLEHRAGAAWCGLQPQPRQGIEKAPLCSLNLHPAPTVGHFGQIGQHPGLPAGHAVLGVVIGRHCKIARLVLGVVVAQPVQAAAVLGGTTATHPAPKARAILRGRCQGSHGQCIGQKCQGAATVHTLHAIEKTR